MDDIRKRIHIAVDNWRRCKSNYDIRSPNRLYLGDNEYNDFITSYEIMCQVSISSPFKYYGMEIIPIQRRRTYLKVAYCKTPYRKRKYMSGKKPRTAMDWSIKYNYQLEPWWSNPIAATIRNSVI